MTVHLHRNQMLISDDPTIILKYEAPNIAKESQALESTQISIIHASI